LSRSVAHQAAGRDERAILGDRRQRVAERQCGKLFMLGMEEEIRHDHERASSQLDQGCEDRVEIAIGARIQDMELQPESVGCRMQGSQKGLSNGTGRVDKHGNDGGHRQQFVRKIILHI
jgi:hypothetical protein